MFARTERLFLRPGWIEDARELQSMIGDEAVVRNLATAPWPYALDDAHTFLQRPHAPTEPSFLITLRTGGAPKIIGGVGIGTQAGGNLELGYWIARPYWGLGFATEAARAVLGIARAMNLPRLTASHMVDNPASGKVLRKLGFKPTGRIVNCYSAGRASNVATVEYAEGEAADCDAVRAMQSRREQSWLSNISTEADSDPRRAIRLMAA